MLFPFLYRKILRFTINEKRIYVINNHWLYDNNYEPKELWKSLKTLGLASIKSSLTNICLKTKDNVTNFDDKENANIFEKFLCTLSQDLLADLHLPSLRFGLHSVPQYYDKIPKYSKSNFKFNFVSEDTVLKFLQDLGENKAAGLNDLSGKFSKDGATVLAKPISQVCNLSIKYSIFPSDCKIVKLKPLFPKGWKTAPQKLSSYILTSFSF